MTDLLRISAREIAAGIRRRDFRPTEVVEAHLRRIEQVNPRLNAVVTPTFERARQEARQADERMQRQDADDLPPLFGVPVTIKDCWPVAGVRFTAGSWYLRDQVAEEDAEPVRQLRQAGAIVVGKTNLPDMCWSGETSNPVFGLTRNPHHGAHTAGGSSGGEGAIIAAGGSPLGLGSDMAGSVRIPAAANGCVALKPTAERLSTEGHLPQVPPELAGWNTAGPMARRVEDLELALRVLSRTPVEDPGAIAMPGRRCLVCLRRLLLPVRPAVAATVAKAAATLSAAGLEVIDDHSLPLDQVTFAYSALMRRHGHPELRRAAGGGRPYQLWREIGRHLVRRGRISPHVLGFFASIGAAGLVGDLCRLGSFEVLGRLREVLLERMGDGGVILCPVLATLPPKHGWIWGVLLRAPYTTIFNALGFPSVAVPVAYDDRGLPMAVQVVAAPGRDEVALAVAAELERAHGGWRPAP